MSNIYDLKNLFKNQDWFYDVGLDNFSRNIVYVHYMNEHIINYINLHDKNTLIHFAGSIKNYKNNIEIEEKISEDINEWLILDSEIDELRKNCGSNILSDIFYEAHDKENAITNLSSKFPDIRVTINYLYDRYGFDILYEKIG